MPQKPVHRIDPRLDSREAVWSAARRLRRFTVRELTGETRLHVDTVRDYVSGLLAAGYIREISPADPPRVAAVYELDRDVPEAPRVRKDGTEVTRGRGRENMWRTMRILKEFTARELAVAATTEEHHVALAEAKDYLSHLHQAGYLAAAPGRPRRYRFLPSRYTGPKPPMVQRVKQVFDPNLGRVVWRRGGE